MGSDVPVIVAKIAKKFDLFHSPLGIARISQNKILMKRLLKN